MLLMLKAMRKKPNKSKRIRVYLSKEEMKMLKKQAEGVSISDYISILILKEEEKVWGNKQNWKKCLK